MPLPVTLDDIHAARDVLADPLERGVIKRTPTIRSDALSEQTGGDVFLKLENLQRTGSFKVRGAYNKIHSLPEEARKRGVIAASAGNHAQGVALAARDLDAPAVICMPENAPLSKVQATRALGAQVVLHGQDYNEAYDRAQAILQERGLTFVHPYDDPLVIAGQGTLALEILEAADDELDQVLVCTGGGGLLAGIAVGIKALSPETRIVGVEPTGAASLADSLKAKHRVRLDRVDTIADGLATRETGELTYRIAAELVDEVITLEDDAIANAVLFLLEREKSLVEGAGAIATAALLEGAVGADGERVAATVSGGNIDVTLLEHIIDRGLVRSGRYVKFEVPLQDRPGALRDLLDVIARTRANVHRVSHDHRVAEVGVRTVLVRIEAETRGSEHVGELLEALREAGYMVALEP
ncbi:MAG: threonine ammonia-lyase [Candidatus Thermoplasmatota archaeon]|nr:threonine ammonia-lyase [Candidatus Thermoplasmatota archaeon]